jgi:FMN phosphatase YigB (HAD superfamily)
MIKAVIFDNFGVLYPQAMGKFFNDHFDLFKDSPEILDKLNSQIDLGQITRREFFDGLSDVCGIPAVNIMSEIDRQMIPDDNLVKLIKKLRDKYKLGIISDAGKEEIAVVYNDGLDDLFNVILASYQVGLTKPSPSIYMECAKRLGVEPPDCVFVDDSQKNIEGAQKVGMQVIYYPEFGKIPKTLKELA